jgi:hypothetical protein
LKVEYGVFLHSLVGVDDAAWVDVEVAMKFVCPRCGRNSEIDEDIGDFPIRCHRCAALLRRRPAREGAGGAGDEVASSCRVGPFSMLTTPASARATGGLPRGTLAGMLRIRPPSEEAEPAIIHARHPTVETAAPDAAARPVLSRETRRLARRLRTREQLLHRAALRGNQRALGALSWLGLALVVVLAIGVAALEAHAAWRHSGASTETARVGP